MLLALFGAVIAQNGTVVAVVSMILMKNIWGVDLGISGILGGGLLYALNV